jgi:hypothetical protein
VGNRLIPSHDFQSSAITADIRRSSGPRKIWLVLVFLAISLPLPAAKEKGGIQYGMGVIVNVPFPESQVSQVVEDVAQNGIIRGTKEYNKDEYVSGATTAPSVKVFPKWTEGGKVFYKVRTHALDPRNFKDGGDVGTLAVRYVVQPQGEKNTVLHIDAIFVEDFRRTSHASNGSVETAEYKDIHDRLEEVASMKEEAVEAEKEKEEHLAKKQHAVPVEAPPASNLPSEVAVSPAAAAGPPNEGRTALTLEKRVQDLRRQAERLVKSPGAPLKSAPFHTASTLQSLPSGTEVLIVVSTPYWLGVETHAGQHGWMLRADLEQLP